MTTKNQHYWFSEEEYARILDNLIVVCVDVLIYDEQKNILLGKRCRLPIKDWWIFGGRMNAGETYEQAASRGVERELGFFLKQTPEIIGYYNLKWPTRNEAPQNNGCDVLLVAMKCLLTSDEVKQNYPLGNDHHGVQWFTTSEYMHGNFHPYLKQIITDFAK